MAGIEQLARDHPYGGDVGPSRIVELTLSAARHRVTALRELERAHPAWPEPLGGYSFVHIAIVQGSGSKAGSLRGEVAPRTTELRRLPREEGAAQTREFAPAWPCSIPTQSLEALQFPAFESPRGFSGRPLAVPADPDLPGHCARVVGAVRVPADGRRPPHRDSQPERREAQRV